MNYYRLLWQSYKFMTSSTENIMPCQTRITPSSLSPLCQVIEDKSQYLWAHNIYQFLNYSLFFTHILERYLIQLTITLCINNICLINDKSKSKLWHTQATLNNLLIFIIFIFEIFWFMKKITICKICIRCYMYQCWKLLVKCLMSYV